MIPSSETITRAKTLIESIEKLQAELASLFNSQPAAVVAATPVAAVAPTLLKRRGRPPGSGKKGGMTAEGRARIAAAAKARWARFHAQNSGAEAKSAAAPVAAPAAAPKKRKMSAAGRAAIIAAQKARWAKIRGQKKAGKA